MSISNSFSSVTDLQDGAEIQAAVKKFCDEQFAAEIYYTYSFIYNYLVSK